MKLSICAVRDRATDSFGNPMFVVATGQAVRSFTSEVNRASADNTIYSHPDDFDLYFLGEFDTNTGLFTTKSPEQICIGKMVKVPN